MKHLPVIIIFFLFLGAGWFGVDFGEQWDQPKQQLQVKIAYEQKSVLPYYYLYPSVSHWLNLVASSVYFIKNPNEIKNPDIQKLGTYLTKDYEYVLNIRRVYVAVVALSIIWIYLLILFWRKNIFEAVLGASLLAFSFEIAYHSRWCAPDLIMMQFILLTTLCLFLFYKNNFSKKWLTVSAITGGFAFGTKYPGGLILVPLLLAGFYYWRAHERQKGVRALFERALVVGSIFGVCFFATTPGAALQGRVFKNDVQYEFFHYNKYGHGGYNVQPGFDHIKKIGTYLTTQVFSHYWFISIFLFIFVLVGMFAVFKEKSRWSVLFFSFPLVYIAYMSTPRVMIVRNLMSAIPFLFILAAIGVSFCARMISLRWVRYSFVCLVLLCLVINASWMVYATSTLRYRGTDQFVRDLSVYLENHSAEKKYFFSKKVLNELGKIQKNFNLKDIQASKESADYAVFYMQEWYENIYKRPANIPFLTKKIFGPFEVNLDYYTTWRADDRIVILDIKKAIQLQLPFSELSQ